MNLKNVLKTYGLLRQLSDDETALLNTLRAMNDSERELLVESLSPEKPAKKPATERNIEHCVACNYTRRAIHHKDTAHKDYHEFQSPSAQKKSKRATSISDAIKGTAGAAGGVPSQLPETVVLCAYVYSEDGVVNAGMKCGEPRVNVVHDKSFGYAGYHPFVEPSLARPAAGKSSSKNGEGARSEASSKTQTEDASSAVHAGG